MADAKRPALGRGLGALIPSLPAAGVSRPPATSSLAPPTSPRVPDDSRTQELDIDLLTPNPKQPRLDMNDQRLDELAQSIGSNGVLQPILVRRHRDHFEIVAGERRWRAAQRAGLLKVPVVVRDISDDKLLEVALIENIQRENLNPIEEAQAYRRLSDELSLSQDVIAASVGKDRATISNYMRLLRLPAEVRGDVAAGVLSMGHARALLTLADDAQQRNVAREVIASGLSVRETEALVRRDPKAAPSVPVRKPVDPNTRAAEEQLRLTLGTRVRIVRKGSGGRLEIDFASEDELQRLYDVLTSR